MRLRIRPLIGFSDLVSSVRVEAHGMPENVLILPSEVG